MRRKTHLVLAHGAGAGMQSPFLERMAELIATRGVTVHRFEFPYMAERTAGLSRRPAPRAESLIEAYRGALSEVRNKIGSSDRLFAGGKSMGGRIACLSANLEPSLAGVVVLGFPLAPPRKPGSSRAGVLAAMQRPALIVQGTRDAFGGRTAFDAIALPAAVETVWIEDGDHDLKPRKASGTTHEEALQAAADAIARFCKRDG
jgi:predicted alpha/beta-hydrolase family hydrolase